MNVKFRNRNNFLGDFGVLTNVELTWTLLEQERFMTIVEAQSFALLMFFRIRFPYNGTQLLNMLLPALKPQIVLFDQNLFWELALAMSLKINLIPYL